MSPENISQPPVNKKHLLTFLDIGLIIVGLVVIPKVRKALKSRYDTHMICIGRARVITTSVITYA